MSNNIVGSRKKTAIGKSLRNRQVFDNESKGNHRCHTILGAIGQRQLQESQTKTIQVSDNVGNYKQPKGNHRCPTILEAIRQR